MFVFRKIWRALFSRNTHVEIRRGSFRVKDRNRLATAKIEIRKIDIEN